MGALSDEFTKSSVVLDRELDQEKSLDPSGPRIRCPLCDWSPRQEDRWSCSCGHSWNTFETGGVCPACLHKVPVLMVNGRYDFFFPTETSQRPMFLSLGTPPKDKRHVVFEAGHVPPNDLMIKEILDWLDRYQGSIQ